MALSEEQIAKLMGMIATSQADDLDCDGCFEKLSEFVELELASQEIPGALQAVEMHLKQCKCCCRERM